MKEADLVDRAVAWLEKQGWEIRCEVYILRVGRPVDICGVRGDQVLMAEAKTGFTKPLKCQLASLSGSAHVVYAVIPDKKAVVQRGIEFMRLPYMEGTGLIAVREDGCDEIVVPQDRCFIRKMEDVRDRILRYPKGVRGGAPNMKGVGPQKDVERAISAYRLQHPEATWKELFANVPNHYEKWQHMYSALRISEKRRRIREEWLQAKQEREAISTGGNEDD